MIDPVNLAARQISVSGSFENKKIQAKMATSPAPVPNEHATADLSALASKVAVAGMAKEPPIDIEAVTRIKTAISEGNYPVDLDQIADHLVESFLGSKR
ncbi:MAG: flagellar biosynthesis anti-sigma factor FlgM [Paracoccaceae bacterium]